MGRRPLPPTPHRLQKVQVTSGPLDHGLPSPPEDAESNTLLDRGGEVGVGVKALGSFQHAVISPVEPRAENKAVSYRLEPTCVECYLDAEAGVRVQGKRPS